MGVKCIRTERTSPVEEPVFLTRNMLKMSKTDPKLQYDFGEKLGSGAFSEVFQVKSKLTGNMRAVKKIDRRRSAKMEQMIKNEFNILKDLDHPNIMKTYEYFEDDEHIYILCELCPGAELFQTIVKRKYFPEGEARQIFYDIAGAVRYMHESHFMHRDLKPQNIVYDPNTKTLKIIDLGSALQFQTRGPQERRRVGTSYYIAPEVLNRFYSQKCDVWSLGVILFILLCGEPPFKGSNDEQIMQKVRNGTVEFKRASWNSVSSPAKSLILKMLERNLKKRLSIEEVLQDEWFKTIVEERETNMSEGEVKSMVSCLSNLSHYKDRKWDNLQEGIITFIVTFVKSNDDASELHHCFKALDLNGDGVLSQEEVAVGMTKYLKVSNKEGSAIASSIFKKVDVNKSGFIDYSEFVLAATNFQLTVSQDTLDLAFSYLDSDGNGSLSADELKLRLGENISEDAYRNMLKEFDVDRDGTISREEFRLMMGKLSRK